MQDFKLSPDVTMSAAAIAKLLKHAARYGAFASGRALTAEQLENAAVDALWADYTGDLLDGTYGPTAVPHVDDIADAILDS